MSHLVSEKSGGNTKSPDNKKTKKSRFRARIWCMTLNNPDPEVLSQLSHQKFFMRFKIKKYLIQEEEGKNGTPHLQGVVQFENQVDFGALKQEFPKIHWEKAKSMSASFKYCGKLDTRSGEVYAYGDVDKYIERDKPTEHEWLGEFREKMTGCKPSQSLKSSLWLHI